MSEDALREPRLEDIAGNGWAGLDALDKKFGSPPDQADAERKHIAAIALKVFSTDDGRKVLEWLADQTVRRSSVPDIGAEAMLIKPEELASYVLWGEAQKALFLRLATLIEDGKRSKQRKRIKR